MGTGEDIERLRNDVSCLFEENKKMRERVTKLEEKGCSWDDKIDELKTSMKEFQALVMSQLGTLSTQITTLINAPAHKLASRWENIVRQVLGYGVVALVTWLVAKGGLQ
jgi:predicted  nucleic acid-binding Zn-ribbon protein